MKCQVCGKNSGFYPLCSDCFEKKEKNEIIKCERCGKWHLTSQECACDTNTNQKVKCIICNKIQDKTICKECYNDILAKKDEIDKNQKSYELKDYYYNLQNSIYRLKTYEIVEAQIKKMFTIALVNKEVNNDTSLINRVEEDAIKLLKSKESLKEIKQNSNNEQKDKTIIATANLDKNRASDGHICKSQQEVKIDDILYKYNICHAYGRKVKEIPSKEERTLTADWYIPLGGTEGIYIEYWGMDTADYEDNKEEKKKIYDKYSNKVKLISIEKEDVNDVQTLEDNLYQQLIELGWKNK